MKNAFSRVHRDGSLRRPWAALLGLLVALVLVACGADTRTNAGAGAAAASSPIGDQVTPSALRASYLAARQREGGPAYGFERSSSGGAKGENAAQQVEVEIERGAASLSRVGAWRVGLRWTGLGRGARIAAVPGPSGEAGVIENRASYPREDGSEEWYESGPLGVEQGFVLPAPPPGARGEALAVEVSVEADLSPVLAAGGAGVDLADARGATVAHYTDLSAFDAGGAALPAWIEVAGNVVRLRVDDAGARYPLTIDPVVWALQEEINAVNSGGAADGAANDWFGFSVSVSGSLAIVGAPNHLVGGKAGAGVAYVFLQTGTTWSLQQELSAGDAAAGDGFGSAVSVSTSASSAIAIVGAPNHAVSGKAGAGAAYVFVQSGTTWTQQAELAAGDAAAGDGFGTSVSVSVSASSAVAIVGAPDHTAGPRTEGGAAYAFAQSGTVWSQQAELTAGDEASFDAFGTSVSVSISTSGTIAVAGAPYHTVGAKTEAGAAYAFVQSGTTWAQQAELTAGDAANFDAFGTSVSVNSTTAFVGAPEHTANAHSEAGAAYVFSQNGTTWAQQQELTAGDGALGDQFGFSVSVSGTSAIVGAYLHDVAGTESAGAAYLFFQTCPSWAQTTEETATDKGVSNFFGYSVAVGGTNAIVGAYQHDVGAAVSAGAAYLYGGTVSAAECCIGGAPIPTGLTNPTDACEVCLPATSTNTWTDEPNGTSCAAGGTCSNGTCISGCSIGGTFYPAGTVNPANACQVCTPASSTTAWSNQADGTTCNDGNACTQTDTCQAGVCTGSNPVVCTASDPCHGVGTCNPGTGMCSNPSLPNGTACNDGNACTQTDTCQAGVCTGSNPVVCPASDPCHGVGTCNPGTGMCSNPSLPNGTACNDGNACTQTDTCQAGVCTGSNPVACTASDPCHGVGTCNQGTGMCSNPSLPNGTACNDGNACTQTDTCQAGVCTGSNPVACTASDPCHGVGTCNPGTGMCSNPSLPNGTTCNDGNACTQTDTCQAGVCTGSNPVTCTASDPCHGAGTCNPGTGMCSNPSLPDGSTCNDANPCTQTDTCVAGVCTGMNPVVCTASDQCHAAGTCDPSSGMCSNPSLPDGSTCDDDNACTQTDACVAGVCTGSNPVVCTASDQCHAAGTCDPTMGTCSNPSLPDGSTCNDENPCTQTDTCVAGVCTGMSPVVCMPLDACHLAGTCAVNEGTCSNPTAPDGTSCPGGTCMGGTCMTGTGGTGGTGTGGSTTSTGGTGGTGTGGSTTSTSGSTTSTGGTGGKGTGGSTTSGESSSSGGLPVASGGCACDLGGDAPPRTAWLLGMIPLLVLHRRRSGRRARLSA